MKLTAIILLALGLIQTAMSILIYFKTDCRAISKELRKTKSPKRREEPINEKIRTVYYEPPKEDIRKELAVKTSQKTVDRPLQKAFLRGAAAAAQDDTALLVYEATVKGDQQSTCDTEPLEKMVSESPGTEQLEVVANELITEPLIGKPKQ